MYSGNQYIKILITFKEASNVVDSPIRTSEANVEQMKNNKSDTTSNTANQNLVNIFRIYFKLINIISI